MYMYIYIYIYIYENSDNYAYVRSIVLRPFFVHGRKHLGDLLPFRPCARASDRKCQNGIPSIQNISSMLLKLLEGASLNFASSIK